MGETRRQERTGPDGRRAATEAGLAALGVNRWLGKDGQCGEMGTLACLPSHEKRGDGHGLHGVQQYEGGADRAPTSLRPESDCGATNAERHRKSSSASSPRRPGGGGGVNSDFASREAVLRAEVWTNILALLEYGLSVQLLWGSSRCGLSESEWRWTDP